MLAGRRMAWMFFAALVMAGVGPVAARQSVGSVKGAKSRLGPLAANSAVISPPYFVTDDPTGVFHSRIDLRSPKTGQIIAELTTLGSDDSTGNGMAVSSDGLSAYLTLVPSSTTSSNDTESLRLAEVSTRDRALTVIGYGDAPAVSPDGSELGYLSNASGNPQVVIRDSARGVENSIGVKSLLGADGNLENAATAWLSDDRTVVVMPGKNASARTRPANSAPTAGPTKPKLIEVTSRSNGRLVATQVPITGLTIAAGESVQSITTDGSQPNTVYLERLGRDDETLYLAHLANRRASATRLLTIPRALIAAIDPTRTKVLYLKTGNPPALWVATIRGHRLTDPKRLLRQARLGNVAW